MQRPWLNNAPFGITYRTHHNKGFVIDQFNFFHRNPTSISFYIFWTIFIGIYYILNIIRFIAFAFS